MEHEIEIPAGRNRLAANFVIPTRAKGLVIFAHGSGSSRLSPRNRTVAERLQHAGFATLLFDLLTTEEDQDYATRFDIDLLSERLVEASLWVRSQREVANLAVGYFGASTGAAAAIRAAAELGEQIAAVVSRGGRPDLAGLTALHQIKAPTLLIVGGLDTEVISLNEQAFGRLTCPKELRIVKGATHLFEEPGKLDEAAALAVEWFESHLVSVSA